MAEIREDAQLTNNVISLDAYRQKRRDGQEQMPGAQTPEHTEKLTASLNEAGAQNSLINAEAFEKARQEKLEATRKNLLEQNLGADGAPSTSEKTPTQEEYALKRMQEWGLPRNKQP